MPAITLPISALPVTLTAADVTKYTVVGGIGVFFQPTGGTLIDFGAISEFEFNPMPKFLDHYSTRGGQRRKDVSIPIEVAISFKFKTDTITQQAIEAYFMSTSTTLFDKALFLGAAAVVIQPQAGTSILYNIPKALLKPDGGLSGKSTDWLDIPFVIEVLDNGGSNPFGTLAVTEQTS